MLQQIPQPFVMATFISTMLIPPPITLPGTGETWREEKKEEEGQREEKVVKVK